MPRSIGRWTAVVAVLTMVAYAGCRRAGTPDEVQPSVTPAEEQPAPGEVPKKPEESAMVKPKVEEPPPPPKMPEVLMTEADREKCVLWVDDPMPDAELPDPAGQTHSVSGFLGETLTVVFFWTRGSTEFSAMAARQTLGDLQEYVYEPYAEKGVQVIAINEADTPEEVQALVDGAGATFTTLLDPDGALFAQVAKEQLPRPYLLDAEGKILWFDCEFSLATREKLLQAIQAALIEAGKP